MNKSLTLGLLALVCFGTANAVPVTYALKYSGASYGNLAAATGTITLDPSLITNPGGSLGVWIPFGSIVTALSLTVTGATAGNGTFTLANFASWTYYTNGGTLDWTKELVGQLTNVDPWGTTNMGLSGDFNISTTTNGVPWAYTAFTLETNYSGSGDQMMLASFAPAPLPATLWLLGPGVLLAARRRRAFKVPSAD